MRGLITVLAMSVLLGSTLPINVSADTEQELVDKFLKRRQAKHSQKVIWVSGQFSFNRINRDNDYNKFVHHVSPQIDGATMPWIGDAKTFGLELGMIVHRKLAWSIGGEYWLKLGSSHAGDFAYTPPGGVPTIVNDLSSEVKVWGISSSISYYFFNGPDKNYLLTAPSLRATGSIGYYRANWDLWSDYQNYNISTSLPEGVNTTMSGSAPGFSLRFGLDYPLNFHGFVVGVDFGYLYLNFTNVAWYNSLDQEVVATYDESADGRVNLQLSGFTGKIELKRYFKI